MLGFSLSGQDGLECKFWSSYCPEPKDNYNKFADCRIKLPVNIFIEYYE